MEQSAELRERTLKFYQAMEKADVSFFGSLFSQEEGALAIGTDPEEWWVGHGEITEIFEAQFTEANSFSIIDPDPQAYTEGNVGWVADQYNVKLSNGNIVLFRVTAVFHKEVGEWKIVQLHASLGVPNEEVFG